MCGIFCHIGPQKICTLPGSHEHLLRQRGPDSLKLHHARAGDHEILFAASVLSLRGDLVEQPLVDSNTGSVFCWNGEAWKVSGAPLAGNDSGAIFELLLLARAADDAAGAILNVFSSICGPYAFVFYDAPRQELYFGRDCLGRRSLLIKHKEHGSLSLSSVGDLETEDGWCEVEADGMYRMSIQASSESLTQPAPITHFPLLCRDQAKSSLLNLVSSFTVLLRI
jgi:asparagine synthetase B (glutamine-hydrolysing)